MSTSSLARQLSRRMLLFYGTGTILGAGIYVLIGEVARDAGSLALLSFIAAAAIAAITAVSYAALAAEFPVAAGEAAYVRAAFGNPWLTLSIGLLLALTGVVSAGVLARGFEGYLQEFVALPGWLVISTIIILLGALASAGVRIAAGVAVVITLVEIAGLLIVLVLTRHAWHELPQKLPELLVPLEASQWVGIGTGAVLAFYAFIGFEDMVNMAEEARCPARDLPFALFGSLAIATVLYLLVGAAALLSIDAKALAESRAPLATVVRVHDGPAWLISSISLVAVLNGALVQMMMSSRVLYGLSQRSSLPAWLGRVNETTQAPVHAAIVATIAALILAISFPIDRLAEATTLLLLGVFASVHAALLKLDQLRIQAGISRFWPMLGFATCCGLILFRLFHYAY
jgi:basic amino acid/polyamine antiporter, APA family